MMRVGITYDLRQDYLEQGYSLSDTAEFDRPDTIDAISDVLQTLGYDPVRIGNIRALTTQLANGQRWDLVFNIAEGLHGFGREAQVPALLDAYQIPYTFSDPLTCALTLHKARAKQIVRDAGVLTPDYALIERIEDIDQLDFAYPLFAKPVAEGTSKGISADSKINSPQQLRSVCEELLEAHRQPVLVETYLPGREFTLGIIGSGAEAGVIGVLEVCLRDHSGSEVYSFVDKEFSENLVDYRLEQGFLAEQMSNVALKAWRALGCRDGGRIDLRLDQNGQAQFLEANPLAGLHPQHSDLPIMCNLAGISYLRLIERIMDSALDRCFLTPKAKPILLTQAVA